jgi:CHAT domain-containing protein
MSLWSVEDESTQRLMSRMYDGLVRRKPLEVADALRAAQLEALDEARREHGDGHPRRWSAFIAATPL